MDKPQILPQKTPIHFPHRPKPHLKSQTYTNLVRIISECYNHPHLCKIPPSISQELIPAYDSNEPREASARQVLEQSELVTPDGTDHNYSVAQNNLSTDENVKAIGLQDGGFSDTQAVIYEIENIMGIEEDENTFKEKDTSDNDGSGGSGVDDKEFGQLQQVLMDELEHVMKGSEDVVHDNNCNFSTFLLDENRCGADKERASQNTCELIELSVDKSMDCKVLHISENNEEKNPSPRTNLLEVSHEMQQKEMESGKSVCANDAADSSNMIEDGKMEEGEIAGEFEVDERLDDMPLKDSALPLEQNKQLSEEFVDKNKFPSNDKRKSDRKDPGSLCMTVDMMNVTDKKGIEAKDVRNQMACKRKVVVYEDSILAQEPNEYKKQKKGHETKERNKGSGDKEKKKGNIGCPMICSNNSALSSKKLDQGATGSQGITCKEKQDSGLCNKKKRGPPSEEKKEKKKEKKRKKRAQKNRELGVKRLKLRPVEKPKPVVFCRHYIRGRCQEGEKCKFSHDTIPLTKSKPCCHFARNSCLKGDDCPFDHELSKYPCTNYASTGSCSRGDDCMFSHKLPLKEDLPSASNVCTPDLNSPSLPHASNSKKQLDSGGISHHTAKASPDTGGGLSRKDTERNVPKGVLGPHVLVPKGISFLSAGKSSVVESSHSTPRSSSLSRSEGFKVGNQRDQSAAGSNENSNEIPKRIPAALIPNGINFLSFGRAPLEFSGTRNLTSDSGAKSSLSSNFDAHKQSSFPGNDVQVGKETSESVSNSKPWLKRMLQKTEFAASSLKSNSLSFNESSINASIGNAQDSMPSSSATLVDRTLQESEILPDRRQDFRTISHGQPASPLGSGQSADCLGHARLKSAPNSAQKALISTLAFAAKVESQMKSKQPTISTLSLSSRADKETEDIGKSKDSQNNLAKASKILDFLSSVGDKTKR
ncbi:conserved hypothetical protein [Ricinus communis]|uniref:C3H1-type domain-containing protein n=1 Tax=Ricinus communis TaxID=3988 RepID=B9S9D2_RICCO|nr:conserved hypothetical protein [Ricinus communis]|eukprot:XP_002522601.1 uncharacterized protein LOC8266814 isoform X1 [Ricinus communis]